MLKLKVQLLFTMPFAGRSLDFFSRFVLFFLMMLIVLHVVSLRKSSPLKVCVRLCNELDDSYFNCGPFGEFVDDAVIFIWSTYSRG